MRYSTATNAVAGFQIVMVLVVLFSMVGWVMNIIAAVGMLGGPVTALFLARLVGVPFAPLGAVLGWFW